MWKCWFFPCITTNIHALAQSAGIPVIRFWTALLSSGDYKEKQSTARRQLAQLSLFFIWNFFSLGYQLNVPLTPTLHIYLKYGHSYHKFITTQHCCI